MRVKRCKHGLRNHVLYSRWLSMRTACFGGPIIFEKSSVCPKCGEKVKTFKETIYDERVY